MVVKMVVRPIVKLSEKDAAAPSGRPQGRDMKTSCWPTTVRSGVVPWSSPATALNRRCCRSRRLRGSCAPAVSSNASFRVAAGNARAGALVAWPGTARRRDACALGVLTIAVECPGFRDRCPTPNLFDADLFDADSAQLDVRHSELSCWAHRDGVGYGGQPTSSTTVADPPRYEGLSAAGCDELAFSDRVGDHTGFVWRRL
jgi:hypothetical protein